MSKSAALSDLITNLYASVSGEDSSQRDWDLFANSFHPEARMVVLKVNGEVEMFTPAEFRESFIERVGDDSFAEVEIETSQFLDGSMATVWSRYEAIGRVGGQDLHYKGFNSIQAIHVGDRWKIMHMFWERPVDI